MKWNYRLYQKDDRTVELVEAFYNSDGQPIGYSEPFAQDVDHEAYEEALRQPLLHDADCVEMAMPDLTTMKTYTLDEAKALVGFETPIL
jgi:hypothetical protein